MEPKPLAECYAATGKVPLPTRWVDCDKSGGFGEEELWARLCVCETRRRSNIPANRIVDVFSATHLETF